MSDTASQPLLEVVNVSKQFPGVRALSEVNLTLGRGEVLALIGENGAGKSTLMKILGGVQEPDSGEVRVDGQAVRIDGVQRAHDLGIALIHQELNLSDNLDAASNVFLGREPRRLGLIDRRTMERESAKVLDRVGLKVSPRTVVGTLSIGRQQLVEIAKALSIDARVLIMDEPTSSLSQRECEQLFVAVKALRERGVSVIYISHRLGEVRELADRVVVLRDGCNAGELAREEIEHDRMVKLMVGRDVSQYYARQRHAAGEVVLAADRLRTPANPKCEVSFSIRAGEMVGVAGLVGAGRTELIETLFGITPAVGGTLRMGAQVSRITTPKQAIERGMALVPEDRKQAGLILEMAVRENASLASLRRMQRWGFLDKRAERKLAGEMIERLGIRTPDQNQLVQYLSGGNQQKVVLAKWLALEPDILLLDEPTRGIDIGAKEEIYTLMEKLAERGVAILFVSSEMEEILGMSDRAIVMHEGRITGELSHEQLSEQAVMQLATGGSVVEAVEESSSG